MGGGGAGEEFEWDREGRDMKRNVVERPGNLIFVL